MKIGFAQISSKPSYEEGIEQCLDFMLLGSKLEVDVICFPEMQFTHFFPRQGDSVYPFQIAEEIPGPTVELFQRYAKQLGMVVVLSIMERFNYEFYNSSAVINSNGKLLGVTRLVHIPQMEGYYAQSYFTPSCGDFNVYITDSCSIGVLISYDRHFPEASRTLALNGADIILIPGFIDNKEDLSIYKAELQTIAYQNSIFVGMCNRAGKEDDVKYVGSSMLVNPNGEINIIGSDQNELVVTEIDINDIREERSKNQYLRLRRPDEYLQIIKQTCKV